MATLKISWLKLLYRVSGKLPLRVITARGDRPEPYLERYSLLRSRWLTIYLHRFVRRDQDLELHDHPWPALSLVLAGQYRERRLMSGMKLVERDVKRLNLVRSHQFHMIVAAAPETWTLFIHGPKRKHWGFLGAITEGQASFTPAAEGDPRWHLSSERPERQPLKVGGEPWRAQTNEGG